jgi:predicted nuclease of predicted toxin-antitoxin system
MRLLIDHCVRESLANALIAADHDVFKVRDQLGQNASDAAIVAWATVHRLVIVTHNYRHFHTLADKALDAEEESRRTWGLLCLKCKTAAVGEQRVLDLWAIVEHEHGRATARRPQSLLLHMDIGERIYSIHL